MLLGRKVLKCEMSRIGRGDARFNGSVNEGFFLDEINRLASTPDKLFYYECESSLLFGSTNLFTGHWSENMKQVWSTLSCSRNVKISVYY